MTYLTHPVREGMMPRHLHPTKPEDYMALLYNQFGVRHFEFVAHFWPDLDDFSAKQLRRLFGELDLGTEDQFTSCDLRGGGEAGARFTGERWTYDLSSESLMVRSTGYLDLRATVRSLLQQTRTFFGGSMAFYTNEMRIYGTIPDDKDRHVGEVVLKRLLPRLKQEDRDLLPGLVGAGLRLVGDSEDDPYYHWHAAIEPPHGTYDVLGVSAQLLFGLSLEPPTTEEDLDTIDTQLQATVDFITTTLPTFASRLFK